MCSFFTSVNFNHTLSDNDSAIRLLAMQVVRNVAEFNPLNLMQSIICLIEEGL